MKPFGYVRPASTDEAVRLRAADPAARFLGAAPTWST